MFIAQKYSQCSRKVGHGIDSYNIENWKYNIILWKSIEHILLALIYEERKPFQGNDQDAMQL